jgi:MFS family permease
MEHASMNKRYVFIFTTCIAAGVAQGLLLPLLAQILEERGVPSSINGLQSSLLYLGTLLASPFMAYPVKRWGYKPVIWFGTFLVAISYVLFPILDFIFAWSVLRLMVGIGLSALHFASQLWIQTIAPIEHRGKMITLYGMFYGVGFGVGPLGLNLLQWGLWVPFGLFALFLVVILVMIATLSNEYPERQDEKSSHSDNYRKVWRYGYLGLIPPMLYGFMEAGLVSTLPVVGSRTGLSPSLVSICLSSFVVGSIVLQLPLGWLSDRWGRKPVILWTTGLGGILFGCMPFVLHEPVILIALFALTGAFVGSIFSLGMVFATDLIPKSLLPNAGIIATIGFGLASMGAPNVIGLAIQYVMPTSLFYLLGASFVGYAMLVVLKAKNVTSTLVGVNEPLQQAKPLR